MLLLPSVCSIKANCVSVSFFYYSYRILYVVNRVLEPLGVLDLFANSVLSKKDNNNNDDKNANPFFDLMIADGWNRAPNLTSIFETFKGWNASKADKRCTILIPFSNIGSNLRNFLERLDEPEWFFHRQDLLSNLVYQGTLDESELRALARSGTSQLTMLGGMNHTFEIGHSGKSYIYGSVLFDDNAGDSRAFRGVDG